MYPLLLFSEGAFLKYNFGPVKNKLLYGSRYPPAYNLSGVSSPVYLHYSDGDNMVDAKVRYLADQTYFGGEGTYLYNALQKRKFHPRLV